MPRVLVVDDDEGIRRLLKDILENIQIQNTPLQVALCENLEEVQNLFPENESGPRRMEVDIAIVDGKFPLYAGTGPQENAGIETASYLRRARPGVQILAISSRPREEITWGDGALQKPFKVVELKAALTELIARPQRPS